MSTHPSHEKHAEHHPHEGHAHAGSAHAPAAAHHPHESQASAGAAHAPAPAVAAGPGSPITHEAIALRAYGKYLARGKQNGYALEDWFTAERELRAGLK